MKKIHTARIYIVVLLSISFMGSGVIYSTNVSAQGSKSNLCEGANLSLAKGDANSCSGGDACVTKNAAGDCTQTAAEQKLNNLIAAIVNIISVIVGIIAVVMIIIGGAKFITSGGDSGKVSSAKSTVIYALVGLVIVALAQFIVRFVLSKT